MRYFIPFLFSFCLTVSVFAQKTDHLVIPPFQQAPERQLQFPLKTGRMIYSDSLVTLAQENIRQYASAKAIKEQILQSADKMLTFSDDELTLLMADARVPRGFDLCAKGCPVHGDTVFKIGGGYPWIIDMKHPFQVRCPVDGQVFPSNDYAAYYQSDFKGKFDPDAEFADDGWGWIAPDGERYWFVAHANQWIWFSHLLPGMLNLARAYLLTGDNRYASKAAFMLYRLATVYPSMDHEDQSRYGVMQKSRGERYPGKILNAIWETNVIDWAAEAYDMVWETVDTDLYLQAHTGKTGEQIRAFIEANLLEEGIDAIEAQKIKGNYGTHQRSMITLQLARQYAGIEKALRTILYEPSPVRLQSSVKYAIYNNIFRDGNPFESPGYNAGWLQSFMQIEEKLPAGYKDLFATFRFREIYDVPLDMVAIGKYTPDIGDSGSSLGGLTARSPDVYQAAYNLYHDPRYLPWINLSGEDSFISFQSLFRRPLPAFPALHDKRAVGVQPSRLFAGYGVGILNGKSDETAVAFTYGRHYAHYHWDYLNFEVFAGGQKMMPDLGYPDAMNTYVPEVYTWSSNTVAHNTVVVDQKRQAQNTNGQLHDFAAGGFARTMDASSSAYRQTTAYRRSLFMVDTEDGQSYLVDFFNVCGGSRHDYLLHGPPGKTYLADGEWGDILPGTFAGKTVEAGYLYDDERLLKQGKETGYNGYGGSGFQHLFNVRQLKSGKGNVTFCHLRDEDARLRIIPLTTPGQELHLADAYDKPRAKNHIVKFLICTNSADGDTPLKSTFVSVLEPFKGEKNLLNDAQTAKPDKGAGHVVLVDRGNFTDIIIHDPSGSAKKLNRYRLQTDAVSTVVTLDKTGKLVRAFFSCGSYLHCKGEKFTAEPVTGKVVSVDALQRTIQVEMPASSRLHSIHNGGQGQVAYFTNAFRTTVHPLSSITVSGTQLNVQVNDDLLTGLFRVEKTDGNELTTHTDLPFYDFYTGATILDSHYRPAGVLKSLKRDTLTVTEPVGMAFKPGDDAWICNIGAGDQFLVKPVFSWERSKLF